MINWIAVEDRLPPSEESVLMWAPDKYNFPPPFIGRFWAVSKDLRPCVTHWAELSDINPPGVEPKPR